MNANDLKRTECAWLLKEAGWALKRLGDRYERCCLHPSADNEMKAQQWLDRARERMQKFRASRAEYLHIDTINGISPTSIWVDELTPKRNPWRAGPPTLDSSAVRVLAGNAVRSVDLKYYDGSNVTIANLLIGVSCDGIYFRREEIEAWRPA